MEAVAITAVRDINTPVSRDRVRINGRRRRDAVLPLFLHLGVHHQQRVVREVDGDLALGIGAVAVFRTSLGAGTIWCTLTLALALVAKRDDLPDAELSRDAQA